MSEESELDRNVIVMSPYLMQQRWVPSSIVVGRQQLTLGRRKERIVEPPHTTCSHQPGSDRNKPVITNLGLCFLRFAGVKNQPIYPITVRGEKIHKTPCCHQSALTMAISDQRNNKQ
jgi:hypothetical protein